MSTFAFEQRTLEDYVNSLAQFLPNDETFAAKNIIESNLRKLLTGMSMSYFDMNGYIKEFTDDISPLVTDQFIEEWESSVGIPDECFVVTGKTNAERRNQIIAKLSFMAVQTTDDFVALADLLGFVVTVVAGIDDTSGATDDLTDAQKRFTIVVDTQIALSGFPYTFPFTFGSSTETFFRCVFDKIAPSNCQVLYNFI